MYAVERINHIRKETEMSLMNVFADILEFVFSSGQIESGDEQGRVDPDEVEACVKFEAEERGINPNDAWEFAKDHIKSR